MFVEVNSLDLVIIDTTGSTADELAEWRRLAEKRECAFVADASSYDAVRRNLINARVFKRLASIPPEAATIKAILKDLDLQPYQAVYVTTDPSRMLDALANTHVGTVLVREAPGSVWPDFLSTSATFVVDMLLKYDLLRVGYLGEVLARRPSPESWACCVGRPNLQEDIQLPHNTEVIALGRFFARGDFRTSKHEYTRRLWRAKSRVDPLLACALGTYLARWAQDDSPDLISALPGREALARTVSSACHFADEKLRGKGAKNFSARFRDGLLRALPHEPQKSLSRADRILNVAGKYPPAAKLSGSPHVMLVDDIITSGATIAEAARSLVQAGAGRVSVVAFAYDQRGIEDPWGPTALRCPCGADRVVRFNNRDHGAFWGCSRYPDCRDVVDFVEGLAQLNAMNHRDGIFIVKDVPL